MHARHDAVRDIVGDELRRCPGVSVAFEVHVPEWDQDSREAWLDLRILKSGMPRPLFIDTTVYHPSGSGSRPEWHEKSKHRRYPTFMGPRRVVPFDLLPVALSVLGGIGPEGAKGLRALLGPRVLHVFPRMSRAVVFWSVRSILDAHGLGGMNALPTRTLFAPAMGRFRVAR